MYIISSRKDFWNDNKITTKSDDEIREVDLLNSSSISKTKTDYISHISGKKVLLLIHGYNNEPNDVMRAYDIIEKNVNNIIGYFDVIVGYSWPGGDDFSDYYSAKNRASAVSNRCKLLFVDTMDKCEELGVMSHSMGCRISLMAYERLQSENHSKTIPIWQYLMAAAVDNESIETGERYYGATVYDDHSYVFHSKQDSVLGNYYRAAEWDRALGYSGPENISDIHATTKVANCKKIIKAHGDYKRTAQIYKYIYDELSGNPRPQFSTVT